MPQEIRKVDPFGGSRRHSVERGMPFWPRAWQPIDQQIQLYWRITEPYPTREVWMLEHKNKLITLLSCASTLLMGKSVGRLLKLNNRSIGSFTVYMPALLGSVGFGMVGQTCMFTRWSFLQPEREPWSLMLGAGAYQILTGVFYPLVFTTGASIYVALRFNTFPIPDDVVMSRESRRYLYQEVIKKLVAKNWRTVLFAAAISFPLTAGFTWIESDQMKRLYASELDKFNSKHGGHVVALAEQAIKASEAPPVTKPSAVEVKK